MENAPQRFAAAGKLAFPPLRPLDRADGSYDDGKEDGVEETQEGFLSRAIIFQAVRTGKQAAAFCCGGKACPPRPCGRWKAGSRAADDRQDSDDPYI